MFKSILTKTGQWLGWLFLAGLVLVAVYVLIGRSMVALVPAYKERIASELSQVINAEVSIKSIQGSWRGLDPVLVLEGVQIDRYSGTNKSVSADDDLLVISAITLQPAIFKTLLNAHLVMERIIVGDVSIQFSQSGGDDGHADSLDQLDELIASVFGQGEGSDWQQLNRLLATPTIEFERFNLHWQKDKRSLLHLSVPTMVLKVVDSELYLSGIIHQPCTEAYPCPQYVHSSAPIHADPERLMGQFSIQGSRAPDSGIDGTLYFSWNNPSLFNPLVDWLARRGTMVDIRQSEGAVWLTAREGEFNEAVLTLQPTDFEWENQTGVISPVENLAGNVYISQDNGHWRAKASELSLNWSDLSLGGNGFLLTTVMDQMADSTTQGFQVQVDRLNIALLRGLLTASNVLPEAIASALQNYAPSGELSAIQVEVWPSSKQLSMAARLNRVAVQAYGGTPEIANINGTLVANEVAGSVEFAGEQLKLGLPRLYHNSWRFQEASGKVSWQLQDEAIAVTGEELLVQGLEGKRGHFSGGFSLEIPINKVAPGLLNLSLATRNADASLAGALVPGRLVGDKAHSWLQTAFSKGRIPAGTFSYHGEIGSQADAKKPEIGLRLDIDDVTLMYLPEWPQLSGVKGKVELEGAQLTGAIESGSIGGTVVRHGGFLIKNLNSPFVEIQATARPRAKDWLYWLHQSPAAPLLEKVVGDWRIDGQSVVDFSLLTKLDGSIPVVLTSVSAKRLTLESEALGLDIKEVVGKIDFDSRRGLSAQTLSGQFLNQQLTGKILTPTWSDTEHVVKLELHSQMSTNALADLVETDWPLPVVGQFSYDLDLIITTGESAGLEYSIASDLFGLRIDLPPPFNKSASERLETVVSRQFTFDGQPGRWRADIKGWLDISLRDAESARPDKPFAGLVRFDHKGKYELPESGFEFVGTLPQLNIKAWQAALEPYGSTDSQAQRIPDWLTGFNVNVGRLLFGAEVFDDANISGHRSDPAGITIRIRNSDRIEGRILVPYQASDPFELDLKKLHLNPQANEVVKSELLPQSVPIARVMIADLRFRDKNLGSWSWITQRREGGIVFENVETRLQGAIFSGRLSWLYDKEINVNTSILTGSLKGGRFQDLSKLWAEKSPLDSESYSLSTGLVWGRSPTDFSWEHVTGKLSFDMKNGKFNDTAASADIFRIFGILNTDALTRRLRLDFSDIYEKGLAYDQIEGKAKIRDGVIHFESPLAVQAPSSAFKITGTTNLVDDSLDMEMVVVLPLTKNLPLASLLVGVPQIGGAVFLIDKLLGEPLSSLTSATYRVSGTLQKPEINLLRIFDNQSETPSGSRRNGGQN